MEDNELQAPPTVERLPPEEVLPPGIEQGSYKYSLYINYKNHSDEYNEYDC